MHPYDKIVELMRKVRKETGKYCSFNVGFYTHDLGIQFYVYSESGWHKGDSHAYFSSPAWAVEFLEDFLRHRANREILYKKF